MAALRRTRPLPATQWLPSNLHPSRSPSSSKLQDTAVPVLIERKADCVRAKVGAGLG